MTDTNPSNPREDELREKILKVNVLKDYNYTPKNVVLVTLDDIEEIFRELAPYTMSKLDAIKARGATMQAASQIEGLQDAYLLIQATGLKVNPKILDIIGKRIDTLTKGLAAQTNGEGGTKN